MSSCVEVQRHTRLTQEREGEREEVKVFRVYLLVVLLIQCFWGPSKHGYCVRMELATDRTVFCLCLSHGDGLTLKINILLPSSFLTDLIAGSLLVPEITIF